MLLSRLATYNLVARRARLPKPSALVVGTARRATVAMAFALTAAVSAFCAIWLTARARIPAANAPQMCTTEKPEAPTPSGAKGGKAFSLHLRRRQTHSEEYVARVLVMVCSVSAAEAASLAMQAGRPRSALGALAAHLGTWERAIAEHAYEGIMAKGVLVDLIPAYVHRGELLAAVKENGMALEYASPELQADRDVVLAAVGVQQNGRALKYRAVQADREVVMAAACSRTARRASYASQELQANLYHIDHMLTGGAILPRASDLCVAATG